MIIILDTETTGLPPRGPEGLLNPLYPYPVQLGWIVADETLTPVISDSFLVRPPDGVLMHPKAAEIHGISNERLRDEGVPVAEALDRLIAAMPGVVVHAAYNLPFDEKILLSAYMRTHGSDQETAQKAIFGESYGQCVMRLAAGYFHIHNPSTGGYRNLKLSQAYRRIVGLDMLDAHDALGDVRATLVVLKAIYETTPPNVASALCSQK